MKVRKSKQPQFRYGRTSGIRTGATSCLVVAVSVGITPSIGIGSVIAGFFSVASGVDETPRLGEAIRELADGSRLAVKAAFKRFSASSASFLSCSSAAKAFFWRNQGKLGVVEIRVQKKKLTSKAICHTGRKICIHMGRAIPYFSPNAPNEGKILVAYTSVEMAKGDVNNSRYCSNTP